LVGKKEKLMVELMAFYWVERLAENLVDRMVDQMELLRAASTATDWVD
jgi:hypothetical protein